MFDQAVKAIGRNEKPGCFVQCLIFARTGLWMVDDVACYGVDVRHSLRQKPQFACQNLGSNGQTCRFKRWIIFRPDISGLGCCNPLEGLCRGQRRAKFVEGIGGRDPSLGKERVEQADPMFL